MIDVDVLIVKILLKLVFLQVIVPKESFQMRYSTSCTSQNVKFLIECKRSNMQYIGQTNQQVSKRTNSHRFDINNYDDQGYATNVALHINSDSHSLDDFRLFVSILSIMRWIVFVRKLTGFINLTRFIQRA